MQLNDTISTTGINLSAIEPEFSFLQDLQPSKQRSEYWNNLGSSKSRSVIQEKEARKVIEGIVTEAESETVFVLTDGSCKGNPGPYGAGACLFSVIRKIRIASTSGEKGINIARRTGGD